MECTLHKGAQTAFDSGRNSDLEIRCRGKTFKVHKVIVTEQSDFFKAALSHNYEGVESGVIEISNEEHIGVLEAVIKFLYGIQYKVPEDIDAASFHALVYYKSDFYQVPTLKIGAMANFAAIAKSGKAGAKAAGRAAGVVYQHSSSGDQLRQLLCQSVNRHLSVIAEGDTGLQAMLDTVPQIFRDLVDGRAAEIGKTEIQCCCSYCCRIFTVIIGSKNSDLTYPKCVQCRNGGYGKTNMMKKYNDTAME